MEVCIFKSLHSSKPQRTSLEKIVEMIMASPLLKQYTLQARGYYRTGKKRDGDKIKRTRIPAFAPCGYLLGGKGRDNLTGLTGLCFIDIDKVHQDQVEKAMEILRDEEHVLFAARSISGNGIHILVPYHLWREEQDVPISATPKMANLIYRCVFNSTASRFHELLQLPIDQNAENAERLCLISFDDCAYYNPSASPIVYRYISDINEKMPEQYDVYEG